jgi:cytoskeleton protein RodZ
MESLGKYLKKERELRNLSIEEVARFTKVREQFLGAIEEDRFELLPAPLYLKGFLAAYARYLGLDPNDVILRYQKYRGEISVAGQKQSELKPQIQLPRKRVGSWLFFVLISTILVLVSLSIFYFPYGPSGKRNHTIDQKKSTPTPIPLQPSPLQIEEKVKTPATQPAKQVEVSNEGVFFEVIKAGIGTGIEREDDHLVLKGKSVEFRCNNQKIFFLTRIKTSREEKIAHVWFWEGKEYHSNEMEVKPPEYSVYSYLTLRPHQSGNWKAEIKVGETVLTSLNFKATEPHPVEE